MKQLGLLTSFFILLLWGTNLYAQAGGQTPKKAPAKKKHTQTNWIRTPKKPCEWLKNATVCATKKVA